MRLFLLLSLVFGLCACQKKKTDSGSSDTSTSRYLYVAAGACATGTSVTTFTAASASNLVYRINLDTGVRDSILADYWSTGASPGVDTPVGIADWDADNVMVLVTNGSSGRLEIVPKSGSAARTTFNLKPSTATVLASAPRSLLKTSDSGLIIVRSAAIEKVTASGSRYGAPYILGNIGGPCGSNTNYTSVASTPFGIVATVGVAGATDHTISVPLGGTPSGGGTYCSGTQATIVAGAWPVATVYDASKQKLLVAYAGNGVATNYNSIVAYDYSESDGSISGSQVIYDASLYPATFNYFLYDISAMTLDSTTNTLYVSTVTGNTNNVTTSGNNYVIEKFTYDSSQIGTNNDKVLTPVTTNGQPFYNYGSDTRCISQMMIAE